MTQEDILAAVDEMTVKDLHALVKSLEEKYDVSAQAAMPMMMPGAGAAGNGGGTATEEKTSFKVLLKNAGQQKIQIIKAVKEITGKGLKDCKELVDKLPATIKEGLDEEEAGKIKARLEEAGGEVELA
ncbi:MAG TPA: 50S ribosomal protein L7/L12 [Candidatus Fraserbacteria bacterium]|nr:50S ribosomal protein L7/L12 [Candidatus Fraserbacteria bacterium]